MLPAGRDSASELTTGFLACSCHGPSGDSAWYKCRFFQPWPSEPWTLANIHQRPSCSSNVASTARTPSISTECGSHFKGKSTARNNSTLLALPDSGNIYMLSCQVKMKGYDR